MAVLPLVLPSLGEGIIEAQITSWLKQPGEPVKRDEPLFEVATDKADIEVPSPFDGFLRRISSAPGTRVRVYERVAILSTSATEPLLETTLPTTSPTTTDHEPVQPAVQQPPPAALTRPHSVAQLSTADNLWTEPAVALSPAVKHLAAQHNLNRADLKKLRGTGHHGRLTYTDLQTAIARPTATDGKSYPLSASRQAAVEAITTSAHQHVHLTTFRTIDFTGPMALKTELKRRGSPVSITALILYGVARILKNHPLLMSWLDADATTVHQYSEVSLGVVISHHHNLIVPTILHADQLSLTALATALKKLTHQVTQAKLKASQLGGGVFTITNPGMFGGQASTAIIYGNQSAILSVGELTWSWRPAGQEKPAPGSKLAVGQMIQHPTITLGLTFDHRLIDGRHSGLFLSELEQFFAELNLTAELEASQSSHLPT